MPRSETVLITGASGGIGYELAKLFAKDASNLVLVARSEARLHEVARECATIGGSISVDVVKADLGRAGSAAALWEEITQHRGLQIDVLVNNAGFGENGIFWEQDAAIQIEMIELNVTALTELTRLALPGMVARGRGNVMNIASTAAFQPGPLMSVYYATKAYVLSFSEAVDNELNGTGVRCTCVCPGPTTTGFQQRAKMDNAMLFKSGTVMTAEAVANIGYQAMRSGKRTVVTGAINKLMSFSTRLAPRSLTAAIARSVQETRRRG